MLLLGCESVEMGVVGPLAQVGAACCHEGSSSCLHADGPSSQLTRPDASDTARVNQTVVRRLARFENGFVPLEQSNAIDAETGSFSAGPIKEPLNNSARSAFQSEKPQIGRCDASDSSRS